MKIIFALMFAATIICRAQTTNVPAWTVTVKVVDDTAKPVDGAQVKIGFGSHRATGLTDIDGVFTASGEGSAYGYGIVVKKIGYYDDNLMFDFRRKAQSEDLHPNLTLTAKKVIKPIPMYAKHVLNLMVPDIDKPIGYDLMVGNWVAPYGPGINSDMLFIRELKENGYYRLTVKFKNKDDGIQVYDALENEKGSALRSPHNAPLKGYQTELSRETGRSPGQKPKFEYDPERVYLIRVRSKMDDRENLVSAYYGKIYGDFMTFTYYLNPTPNDLNLEFNPKENLLNSGDVGEP